MLKLNTDEVRNLEFEVSIQGVNYDELKGSLKFIIEDIEYGIPVKIHKDTVSVEVPPLEEIVARGMKNGDVVECKLDIFGNGFYINPWGGQFELSTPVKMETKQVKIDNRQPDKKIVAELKNDKKSLDKEAILEMLFEKLEEKGFSTTSKKIKTIKESKSKTSKPSKKELVENKIKSKFFLINNLVKNVKTLTEGKKVIVNQKTVPSAITTEDVDVLEKLKQLKNKGIKTNEQTISVDPNDPIIIMESVGMKDPKVQQVMLNKAIELGGDGEKSIAETLRKLLGINQESNFYNQYMSLKERHDR